MTSSVLPHLHSISLLLLLLLLLLPAAFAISQSDCNVNLSSTIYARDNQSPWLSPSTDFAFGFRRVETSDNKNPFMLAIWYYKIPEQTIVWSRNKNLVPIDSSITLTNDGEFILYNPQKTEIWKANNTSNNAALCAAMLDSGNFALINEDTDLPWESFSEPTDTILPGQILPMHNKLISRQSETNYANGRFQLGMQSDGNLVLYAMSVPTQVIYGSSWASDTVAPNPDSRLVFNESGNIYVVDGTKLVYNFTSKDTGSRQDVYSMARVDYDGAFRQYNHPRKDYTTSSWSIVVAVPEDVCAITNSIGSGACGFNSYCINKNGKANCMCPEGYSSVTTLDFQKGCEPDFPLPSCQQDDWVTKMDQIRFQEINNTDWPLSDYELQTGAEVDKETCKLYCLRDCFCAVAIHNGNNCWKKKFPLSNGKQSSKVNRTALIKLPLRDSGDIDSGYICPKKKDRSTLILVVSLLLGSSVFLNFLLLAVSVAVFFWYHKKLQDLQSVSSTYGVNVRSYTYKELEEATGGFKQQLGRGSFGTVYKGILASDTERYVAVKKLDKIIQEGEKEFRTEVSVIGTTHHRNLVRLLGYCDEGEHRLLVYEYMSNGSLANRLFGISRPDWYQRTQIVFGVARGLLYLHEECNTQIIHCDIKPQNILLDEYSTPRIADFGLAKLLLADQSRVSKTGLRGTIGYCAPEWFRKASITVKVDVYSFGVMLLEIICCKSSVQFAMGDEEEDLIDWVYDCYFKRKLDTLVENDEEARTDMKTLERLVMVGIWCIQEDPSLRPTMRKVTQMLEEVVEVSVPPRPTGFSSS